MDGLFGKIPNDNRLIYIENNILITKIVPLDYSEGTILFIKLLRCKPYYHFRGKLHHNFLHADNDNKIHVLLTKTAVLQGFSGKKRPHRIASARSNFISCFAFGFISGFAQNQNRKKLLIILNRCLSCVVQTAETLAESFRLPSTVIFSGSSPGSKRRYQSNPSV